jgi:ANTAR domain
MARGCPRPQRRASRASRRHCPPGRSERLRRGGARTRGGRAVARAECDVALLGFEGSDPEPLPLTIAAPCPIVLCSGEASPTVMRIAHRVRAMAFLIRPIRPDQLEPTIALAVARFREARVLSRSLEERKVIERAKGRLMALHAMTEDAAFRWLRERAMDTRRRIANVARQVLASSSQGNLVTRASVPRAVTATARR